MRNYYEKLVLDVLSSRADVSSFDDDTIEDLACLTLNRLPPRYYRYDVDISFFMSENERIDMEQRVEDALDWAIGYIRERVEPA